MKGLRKFVLNFVLFIGIILLIAWIGPIVEDLGPCGDRAVDEWMDESAAIMGSYNFSLDSAKASFQNQQSIEAPECLLTLQEHTVNIYYYAWKYEEAELQGNYTLATSYLEKLFDAFDKWDIELYRLEEEKGWNEVWDVRQFEDEY